MGVSPLPGARRRIQWRMWSCFFFMNSWKIQITATNKIQHRRRVNSTSSLQWIVALMTGKLSDTPDDTQKSCYTRDSSFFRHQIPSQGHESAGYWDKLRSLGAKKANSSQRIRPNWTTQTTTWLAFRERENPFSSKELKPLMWAS